MGSLNPLMNLTADLPSEYLGALNFAMDHCHQVVRHWPEPYFPPFFHAEQMGLDALKLGLRPAAVEAAVVHDLPLMTKVTFNDLENVISQEAVDLVHEWTPTSNVLNNPQSFNIEEYLDMLSRSDYTVQTLVALDMVQTALNVGNHLLEMSKPFAELLRKYEKSLTKVDHKLKARTEFIEKWLRSRVYEHQVTEYKNEKDEIEYISPR